VKRLRTRPAPRPAGRRPVAVSLVLAAALTACTVTLVSRYDEQLDQSATALQRRLDVFLTGLAAARSADETGYARHERFYGDYAVDLRALLVRARSLPKNERTAEQVDLMLDSVESLRVTHQSQGALSPGYVTAARGQFNQAWQNIIALELAKKR
jgi:hypothetical protein